MTDNNLIGTCFILGAFFGGIAGMLIMLVFGFRFIVRVVDDLQAAATVIADRGDDETITE